MPFGFFYILPMKSSVNSPLSYLSEILLLILSALTLNTLRKAAITVFEPETPVWQPSTHFSATSLLEHQNTPSSVIKSWLFQANVLKDGQSSFLHAKKPMLSLTHPTQIPG
jgi:hypothetical protein